MSSITRAIQAMDLLARKGPLGVRAVAQQLRLPLGSVHRMLLDLEEEQIAERNADGEWELSFRLLAITGLQLDRLELPRLTRPFAERIAQATGETVNVNALSSGMGVIVDKVRGNDGMQLDFRMGSRGPLHCGGAGKAMLAFMTKEEQEHVLAMPLEVLTPHTLSDPKALRAELGRIRARGHAFDDAEVVLGIYCIGMPILDRSGRPVGAMSITGPSPKRDNPALPAMLAMLADATGTVSRRLGFGGDWPPAETGSERDASHEGAPVRTLAREQL